MPCSSSTSRHHHTGAPSTRTRAVYQSARNTEFQIVELRPKQRPISQYLEQVDRIVDVTFPDEDRRAPVGDGEWDITMLEQNFFGVHFAPTCRLRVWHDDAEAKLHVEVSELDLSTLPPELQVPADIKVEGWMTPAARREGSRLIKVNGQVAISLDVDVPSQYAYPGTREVIEAILGGVLARLENSLQRNLPMDYNRWVRS